MSTAKPTGEPERAREGSSVPAGRHLTEGERALWERAVTSAARAYAPYTGFRVGAALRAASGKVYDGVNVENASSPLGMCAERVALGALVTAGERQVATVAVASLDGEAPPCGACLQALAEFGDPSIVALVNGELRAWKLSELLSLPFRLGGQRAP